MESPIVNVVLLLSLRPKFYLCLYSVFGDGPWGGGGGIVNLVAVVVTSESYVWLLCSLLSFFLCVVSWMMRGLYPNR